MSINIIILVDVSVSIHKQVTSYVRCINNVIGTQQKINPSARFSLYTFSSRVTKFCHNVPITDIQPLTSHDLRARQLTALYDSMAHVLTENSRINTPTIFIVLTDGDDTCSQLSKEVVRNMVMTLKKQRWMFVYIGASLHANYVGHELGIDTTVMYSNTCKSINRVAEVMNIAISKATSVSTGRRVCFAEKRIPDDIRDLIDSMETMSI